MASWRSLWMQNRACLLEAPRALAAPFALQNHKVSHIFDSAYSEAIAAGVPGAPVREYQRVLQTAAASLAAR